MGSNTNLIALPPIQNTRFYSLQWLQLFNFIPTLDKCELITQTDNQSGSPCLA
uniref:Uncharacterized protein n=1 Tax=Siphoviridae sp. ctqSm5 TaxID=2827949 RepID=A0A8S5SQA7_9CAUD|nr:MAG TPA: hypothetical protein [Siphoviridae sp. ctqSm5]